MIDIDSAAIQQKMQKLERCKKYLKREFIGIDDIIDSLLDYIQVWYLLPELLQRPVIVNLWGMTGVGKTDLIRKLVKFLDFQDRFTEIELSNTDQSSWSNTVAQILNNIGLNDEKPAILLFDEIQRFNTLDAEGTPLPQTKFTDFWELLSDGRLSRKRREDLDRFLLNFFASKRDKEKAKARGEEIIEYHSLNTWDAMQLQGQLGLDMSMADLAEISEEQMMKFILKAKKEKKIYEPVNHSKSLIIISGNLDEAFSMATETSEADIDADIYHAFTKKITLVDIKNALARKFRPEQVARFGNIHLIYNALRKQDFERLIQQELKRIVRRIKTKVGVSLSISPEVNKLIYRNGVFPVQGVRPVFSSIVDIVESNLSKFLFDAIMLGAREMKLGYDPVARVLRATYGGKTVEVPYVGRIDKIRQSNQADAVANISVHESGHAVVYMVLTQMVPLQLKSKVASSYAGGFTFPHQIHVTKSTLLDKIKVYLAGGLAEELVFGREHASVGRSHDREQATGLAIEFVRKFGFDEDFQAVYNLEHSPLRMDLTVTDTTIEKLMSRLVAETKEILIQHLPLLRELSAVLSRAGSLEGAEMQRIARRFGLQPALREEGYLDIFGYDGKLSEG
ncbi:AAA family ATPase [Neolewinella lacunae]|uniref:AAA family ATPase n=1 Tax=Neolewinella lacunae TaxID=1517758 RepID=A0A923TAM9_9BACT|nr:AAA family ATPase [Neolewinella lacunae]MBC6996686.1 AAA family ATPase [Neolewinella lacunae]MDN3633449.1 AAA family ATPase [Neolewinella lacunae]